MISLQAPISKSRSIVGFTPLEYVDRPANDLNGQYGYVNATVRLHFDDGTTEDKAMTLWDGADKPAVIVDGKEVEAAVEKANSYSQAGEWTTETAAARIADVLAGK